MTSLFYESIVTNSHKRNKEATKGASYEAGKGGGTVDHFIGVPFSERTLIRKVATVQHG